MVFINHKIIEAVIFNIVRVAGHEACLPSVEVRVVRSTQQKTDILD